MSELNSDCPEFECLIRKEFLYDQKEHKGEFEKAVVFGISSIPGRAIGFHCLTQTGAVIWRLPIHALVHDPQAPLQTLQELELWDAFSSSVSVQEFDFISQAKVQVYLRDGKRYPGEYMFTIDWWGTASANGVGELGHKCAHIIKLEKRNHAAQPNNRILWSEQAFIPKPFGERPDYLINSHIFRCENGSKWQTEDSKKMFYEVKESFKKLVK